MLIYVAGKYSTGDVEENVALARRVAIELTKLGHAVFTPHLNFYHFEQDLPDRTHDEYLREDENILSRCDGIVMLPGWTESPGANREYDYAEKIGLPIYQYPDVPDIHPTEVRCPEQAQAFRELTGKMYRTHLDKNADYSPANILGTGEVGLITRLWDKMARLMNLMGFDLKVETSVYRQPKAPKNESVEDTLLDLSVYALIGLLLRWGKWGR